MDANEQLAYVYARTKSLKDQSECARFAMERLAAYIGRNAVIDGLIGEVQAHQRRVQEGLYEIHCVLHGHPEARSESSKGATQP